jgi:KDO2-lipid IV(A) lauroyltransferase
MVRLAPFEGDLSGSSADQAAAINGAMEQLIARCPAQYFWSYNRYKHPDGAPPPASAPESRDAA